MAQLHMVLRQILMGWAGRQILLLILPADRHTAIFIYSVLLIVIPTMILLMLCLPEVLTEVLVSVHQSGLMMIPVHRLTSGLVLWQLHQTDVLMLSGLIRVIIPEQIYRHYIIPIHTMAA